MKNMLTFNSRNLLASDAPLTMSSREISSMLDSRHDKVKQSIERLAKGGTIIQTQTVSFLRYTRQLTN